MPRLARIHLSLSAPRARRRVAWTSGSSVRKLFTLGHEVLQVGWGAGKVPGATYVQQVFVR